MKYSLLLVFAVISSVIIYGCKDNSTDPANTAPNIVISRIDLIKDNNMNGKVNPGETAVFVVRLKNTGRLTLKGAKVTRIYLLEGKDADYYDVSDYNYGDLAPGAESAPILDTNKMSFYVRLKPNAAPGDLYRFEVLIQGDDYRQWRDTLSFTVEKSEANMKVSRIEIFKDPNENGKANPGERLHMNAYIKNVGTSGGNVYLRKLEQIKNGGVLDLLNYFPGHDNYVPAGEECGYGFGFYVDIDESLLPNTILKYRMELANDQCDNWYDTIAVQVERSDVDIKISKVSILYNEKKILQRLYDNYMVLCLENLGKDIARDITIESITTFPKAHYSYNYEGRRYGNISPGIENCGSADYAFSIRIRFDDPVKDKLKVNMVLKDGEGNRWEESFELEVEQ